MIFGLNATESVVIVAETKGDRDSFVIAAIRPIPFQVRSGNDLAELLQTLITLFDRKGMGAGSVIALLKCSSGRFGSCLAAINSRLLSADCASLKLRRKVSKRISAVRRIKNGETVPGNCLIPRVIG